MSGTLTLRFAPDAPLKVDPVDVTLRFEVSLGSLSDALAGAITEAVLGQLRPVLTKQEMDMSELDDKIAELTTAVAADSSQVASAVTVIGHINQMITDAVAAAMAKGATAEQLSEIVAVKDTVATNTAGLAAAIASVGGG
jgi:hypothetical protein